MFNFQTEQHKISLNLNSEKLRFDISNKNLQCNYTGIYTIEDLPKELKDQCQQLSYLYQYITNNLGKVVQVEGDKIKIKVQRIKKQNWYELDIKKNGPEEELRIRCQNLRKLNSELKKKKCWTSVSSPTEMTISEKQQLQKLKNENIALKYTLSLYDKIPLKIKVQYKCIPIKMRPLKNPREPQQYNFFEKVLGEDGKFFDVIKKEGSQTSVLTFSQNIRSYKCCSFKIKMMKNFFLNFFIIGIQAPSHFGKKWCYCDQGSICFSNSMSTIFNELEQIQVKDVLQRDIVLQRNDEIELVINNQQGSIQWFFNGCGVNKFNISNTMMNNPQLYPYLMLSDLGDCVMINYDYE